MAEPARRFRPALVGIGLLGGILAVAAVPRLVAGVLTTTAPGVYESSIYPSAEEAAAAESRMLAASAWHSLGDAGLYLALSRQIAGRPGEDEALKRLLAQSPMRPEQWMRLARLEVDAGNTDKALDAWRMSVFTARAHPPHMDERLGVGLLLKDAMNDADRALLDEQMRLTFIMLPAHVDRLLSRPENTRHRPYYRKIVESLSAADIDHMVRIHALH